MKLAVGCVGIGPEGIADLKGLLNLECLTLDIGMNRIGAIGANYIGIGLKSLVNLIDLSVSIADDNRINEGGATDIFSSLKVLINLKRLSINIGNNNNIKS